MKKFILLFLFISIQLSSQEIPFKKGVNLASWFQGSNAKEVQLNKYTREDFVDLKSLGLDHARIPINMEFMTNGSPDFIVDPLLFTFLDQVIDWAEELNFYIILDNHTFDVNDSTKIDYDNVLIPIWQQMAEHFKNRSNYICYEILNEPHGITDLQWNTIQKKTVDAIREIDSVHTIIIGGAGWNSYSNLTAIPIYKDNNLIYTFHFYDPFLFTHQGASWPGGGMEKVKNIPFPYDASRMPAKPIFTSDEWASGTFNNYINDGTISKVKSLINIADNFSKARNVPVYCGELGVYIPYAPDEDRTIWYATVINYLNELNITWSIWDYRGDFGLFKKGSSSLFDYDLNVDLLEAIGLNVPEQKEMVLHPDSTGIEIYSDYVAQHISSYASGIADFYSTERLNDIGFSIHWSGASRYNSISFNFIPNKDLSYLADNNYQIDFWMKSKGTVDSLDIRFVDSKLDTPEDHPWRMRYALTPFEFQGDEKWYHVQLPLKYFTEQGSWDNNTWYNPVNAFDWSAVDLFEITSEYKDFNSSEFWFDEIKIIDPTAVSVKGKIEIINDYQLLQNYPNPFNPSTTISIIIPNSNSPISNSSIVSLKVFDVLGREIVELINEPLESGRHEIKFDATAISGGLSSGVYFYQLKARSVIIYNKMMLIK